MRGHAALVAGAISVLVGAGPVLGESADAPAEADANADVVEPDSQRPGADLHAGVEIRTDIGTHAIRVTGGFRRAAWDFTAVLDPFVFMDGQHDLDVSAERFFANESVGLLFGWRTTAIAVAGGTHLQQRSIVGFTARLPSVGSGRLRNRLSLEFATLWVKHGGGGEDDWIPAERGILDHVSLGMRIRVEYVAGL